MARQPPGFPFDRKELSLKKRRTPCQSLFSPTGVNPATCNARWDKCDQRPAPGRRAQSVRERKRSCTRAQALVTTTGKDGGRPPSP